MKIILKQLDNSDAVILSLFSKKDLKKLKKLSKKRDLTQRFEFGNKTTKTISLSCNKILKLMKKAKPLSKKENAFIEDIGLAKINSFDVVSDMISYLENF